MLIRQGYQVNAFLDNSNELIGTLYDGTPIESPMNYEGTDELVLITAIGGVKSAIDNLIRLRISNFASYTDYISHGFLSVSVQTELLIHAHHIKREIEIAANHISEDLTLNSIDFVITEKCTMKCHDCANLMQYFEKPQNADYNMNIRSFDTLYRLCDWIYEVRVIGGDAMIDPRLSEYLCFLSSYDRISDIIVYTNGIILPNETLLNALKDKRISVMITDYGFEKQRLEMVVSSFNTANIPVIIKKVTEWHNCSRIKSHYYSTEKLKEVLRQCCMSYSPSLKDGKLWRCPSAGSLFALSAVPQDYNEFVDLLSGKNHANLKQEIVQLMSQPYLKVCDYCGGRPRINVSPIPVAVQTDKSLSYDRYSYSS